MSQKLDFNKQCAAPRDPSGGGRTKTPSRPLAAVGTGRHGQGNGYDGPPLVASEGGETGERLLRQSKKQNTGLWKRAELEGEPAQGAGEVPARERQVDDSLVHAYNPVAYENQMKENGHSDAQAEVLLSRVDYIGERVVSVGCGPGWLDRELARALSRGILRVGRLRILGIDTLPANIEYASQRMEELCARDPYLRDHLSFQYMLANLEGPKAIKGSRGRIPGLADLDLKDTVIGAKSPDTFMAFMVFMWVKDKDAAIKAITGKCRPHRGSANPTYLISGEEYPIRITPGTPGMTEEFVEGFTSHITPISLNRLWGERFCEAGLVGVHGTRGKNSFSMVEDHALHSMVFEYIDL